MSPIFKVDYKVVNQTNLKYSTLKMQFVWQGIKFKNRDWLDFDIASELTIVRVDIVKKICG